MGLLNWFVHHKEEAGEHIPAMSSVLCLCTTTNFSKLNAFPLTSME